MREKKKFLTVILVPDESEEPRTYRLNRVLLKNLLFLAFLVMLGFMVATYIFLPRALDYDRLKAQNNKLTLERLKVLSLLDDFARIKQRDAYIRRFMGVELNLDSPIGYGVGDDSLTPNIDSLLRIPLTEIPGEELPVFRNINFLENIPTFPPLQGLVTAGFVRSTLFREDRHLGIDLSTKVGEPVKAAAEGLVVFSNWTYHSGYSVIVYHGDDYFTVYGHNTRNLVEVHDVVHRGDPIALAGNTGISRGPHLHFEIWYKGKPQDPRDYIPLYRENDISID